MIQPNMLPSSISEDSSQTVIVRSSLSDSMRNDTLIIFEENRLPQYESSASTSDINCPFPIEITRSNSAKPVIAMDESSSPSSDWSSSLSSPHSISTVFNRNNGPNRCSRRNMQTEAKMDEIICLDEIEWCCHKILVEETSLKKLRAHFTRLGRSLSLLEDNDEHEYFETRLDSRLSLALLVYDALSIHQYREDDFSDNFDVNFFSVHWRYEDWNRLEKQLLLTESTIHLENTDRCLLAAEDIQLSNDKSTESLSRAYYEALRSIQVQKEISQFHQRLLDLQQEQKLTCEQALLKRIESAIDGFVGGLNEIFCCEAMTIDGVDNMHIDCDSRSYTSASTRGIPKELVSFLLPQMYRKNTDSLVNGLLTQLHDHVLYNTNFQFSYHLIHQKFRFLLRLWSETVMGSSVVAQQGIYSCHGEFHSCLSTCFDSSSTYTGESDFNEALSRGGDGGKLLRLFDYGDEEEINDNDEHTLLGTLIKIAGLFTMVSDSNCVEDEDEGGFDICDNDNEFCKSASTKAHDQNLSELSKEIHQVVVGLSPYDPEPTSPYLPESKRKRALETSSDFFQIQTFGCTRYTSKKAKLPQ